MAHMVNMMVEMVEKVVREHQFEMGMVSLLFQTGKNFRSHNDICKTFHIQVRGIFLPN